MAILLSLSLLLKVLGVAIPLGLAFVVLLQGRQRLNWIFCVFMLAMALWSAGTFMLHMALLPSVEDVTFWLRTALFSFLGIPMALYMLALELRDVPASLFKSITTTVGFLLLLVCWGALFGGLLEIEVEALPSGEFLYSLDYFSPPFVLGLFYLFAYFFLAEGVLLWPLYQSRRASRVQAESNPLLALGGALTLMGGGLNVFPIIGRYPIDAIFMISASLIFASLIMRAQLLDPLRELNEELALANRRLRESNRKILEANRVKSEFLANMSHELRTPLNSVIGFARVILKGIDGPLTEMQRTDLTAIYTSGQHLLNLVNDILDLTKIEAGKMELHREKLDFHEIIAGVMSTAIALIEGKDIELIEEVDKGLPRVYADRVRVRQVILNLIANAAKFTDRGFIALRAEVRDGKLLVGVADTGIGIAEKDLPVIFEEFRQLDSSTARRAEGTGLGLPISKRLVEMHGGRLWVKSKVGVGSTFYFTLPLAYSWQEQDES
jgi:signal transduction histidine kinase